MALKTTRKTRPISKPIVDCVAGKALSPFDHVQIGDLDVVLLQVADNGQIRVQDAVFLAFSKAKAQRRSRTTWLAFHGEGMPHHAGRSTWIGLSKSVPLPVIALTQRVLEAAGMEVERDMGRALHLNLNPYARLSDDELEVLVPAALVGDPGARRVVERSGVPAIARGYEVRPSKAAGMNNWFFATTNPPAPR